jgi:uncharacterized protein YggE
VRAGANSINGINFDVVDKTQAISEARKLAIEDARATAQELAAAAGVTLGDLYSLNAYMNTGPVTTFDNKGGMAVEACPVPVNAGQLMLSVDVNLSYEIK